MNDEAPSVTIVRLICQLILSVGVLSGCAAIAMTKPEYTAGATLAAGVVLGAWFGVVREPRLRH